MHRRRCRSRTESSDIKYYASGGAASAIMSGDYSKDYEHERRPRRLSGGDYEHERGNGPL